MSKSNPELNPKKPRKMPQPKKPMTSADHAASVPSFTRATTFFVRKSLKK